MTSVQAKIGFSRYSVCKFRFKASIIGIVTAVSVASLLGIAFKVFFLIHDGVTIPGVVIVAGQPLIESGDFFLSLFHAHSALLSD